MLKTFLVGESVDLILSEFTKTVDRLKSAHIKQLNKAQDYRLAAEESLQLPVSWKTLLESQRG